MTIKSSKRKVFCSKTMYKRCKNNSILITFAIGMMFCFFCCSFLCVNCTFGLSSGRRILPVKSASIIPCFINRIFSSFFFKADNSASISESISAIAVCSARVGGIDNVTGFRCPIFILVNVLPVEFMDNDC